MSTTLKYLLTQVMVVCSFVIAYILGKLSSPCLYYNFLVFSNPTVLDKME